MVNMNQLMKQAQEMQKKMSEMQEQMTNAEFEGKAGGGMVTLIINGKSELKKVNIDPSILNKEDKEIIEDLIVAAYNDAKSKIEENGNNSMNDMMGGLGLPPGFKFPF